MWRYKTSFLVSIGIHFAILIFIIYFSYRLFHPSVVNAHVTPVPPSLLHDATSNGDLSWLQNKFKQRFVIDRQFKAIDHLQGYVVHLASDPHNQSIIYRDPRHHLVLLGTLIDRDHGNVTLSDSARYIKPHYNHAIVARLARLQGILQGVATAPVVTIIIDPNSPLFPAIYHNLISDVDQHVFAIKWVLLNYLKPDGPNVAAAIIAAKNPLLALQRNAVEYNAFTQTGGLTPLSSVPTTVLERLRKHWDFIQSFHLYQLPLTVYRGHSHWRLVHGLIMDELLESTLHKPSIAANK